MHEIIFFLSFIVIVVAILMLDLGLFNKKNHIIAFREAISWTTLWVALAIGFYFVLRFHGDLIHGISAKEDVLFLIEKYQHPINVSNLSESEAIKAYNKNLGLEYITGYLIEYALSIDNVFVMIMIFMSFGIQQKYYHKILFWGILGAIIMRFFFIFLSSGLIQRFSWMLYFFGGLLIFTGIRMFLDRNKAGGLDTKNHWVVKTVSRYFKTDIHYKGSKFFSRINGKKHLTPLFIVLLVIEFTDVIFAVDSVPAIFAITKDPYIVFFSNIFAIIGLRSLFFVLMNMINRFHFLKTGLAVLLTVIGIKLIFHDWLKSIGFETIHSLYIVVLILGVSILASILFPHSNKEKTS